MKLLRWALMSACLGAAPALADGNGALVIDVAGDVSPAVDSFEDISAGTVLTLEDGAELIISHYKSCEELTLSGGVVTVGADALEMQGSEVLAREEVDCPATVAMATSDTASATVIVRNFEDLPKVPISPSIVLVGENAGRFSTFTLTRDDKVITSLNIVDRQVQWPEDGLYLSDRIKYLLQLDGSGAAYQAEVVADRRTNARVVLRP